eukprot:1767329-Pleurochrysis_carterae.AAC.1
MCAVSNPLFESASKVPDTNLTKCAVCAGILTLDEVMLVGSDQAAAKLAADKSHVANEETALDKAGCAEQDPVWEAQQPSASDETKSTTDAACDTTAEVEQKAPLQPSASEAEATINTG